MQGQWMLKFSAEKFAEKIRPLVTEKYKAVADDKDFLNKAKLIQDRITFFAEAPEMCSYFYEETKVTMNLLANTKQKVKKEDLPKIFEVLTQTLEGIDDWSEESLKEALFAAAEENDLKRGQILWPMRAAITGLPYSPGAFEVAATLGKEKTLERLRKVVAS